MRINRSGRVLALLAALTLATAPTAVAAEMSPPQASAAIEEAATVVDRFHAALIQGDREAALSLLDDSVQIFEQGWAERSKAEYASHHLESDMAFSKAVTHTRTARTGVLLGDLAYVATEGKMTGRYKEKDVDVISIETMVLRRDESGWRIIHIHWSSRARTD